MTSIGPDFDPAAAAEPATVEPLTPSSRAASASGAANPEEIAFSARTPRPSRMRVVTVAGAAVVLAVGAVATSLAASPARSNPAATSGSTSGSPVTVPGAPFALADPSLDENVELDHGRFGGMGFRDITITTISGSNVTLGTDDGWSRTIAVTDAIDLTKGGQDVELSELTVGDQVRFSQTRNDDGTYTVDAIAIIVPSVRGEVSDVSSSGFKVTTRDGSVWTITVNGATDYQYGTGDGSLADVTNGINALVQGTTTGDNALTALSVHVAADRAIGTVTAKTADTITIKKRDGSTVTVHVDGDTTYRVAGVEDADLGDIAVDMAIGVSGRDRADGSIDGDAIVAGEGRGFRFGGRGEGFDGPGFGPGRGGPGWDRGDDDAEVPAES
jgi:hypothetical protein